MYANKKIIAIIPARMGSKRLPNKNVRYLSGKPLIAWTIECAKDSKYIDRIIVSTDSNDIAMISEKYGAEVPFLRPKKLAEDDTKSIDVIIHTINWLKDKGDIFDILILLQPTSPLRVVEDINSSIEFLFFKKAIAVVSIVELNYSSFWTNTLPEDGCMKDFLNKEAIKDSSSHFERYYRINGAIYIAFSEYIVEKKTFFGNKTFAYIMPKNRSLDIDDQLDFDFADFLIQYKKHNAEN